MPGCHHCGEDAPELREGTCSTCGADGEFCELCGWWELGPEETLETSRWKEINTPIGPKANSLFVSCEDVPAKRIAEEIVKAIVGRCKLMQAQLGASSLFENSKYTYRLWRPALKTWKDAANFVCGKLNQIYGSVTKPEDFQTRPTDPDCRLHCMLLTFLSAYDYGVRSQQRRLILNERTPPLNIHDAAKLAEHHYTSHGGFFGIGMKHTLHDSLTLRHLDTVEQYLKGNETLQMAHVLISSDTQSERLSRQIAINAFRLYSALLPVFEPYDNQKVPNKGTFNASSNGSAGIFTKKDVQRHFYGDELDMVKTSAEVQLHRLVCSFETSPLDPDYRHWFKFHTPASRDTILNNEKLTFLQKVYLLSFPSLDDPKCPARCRGELLAKARVRVAGLLKNLKKEKPLHKKLKEIKQQIPFEGLEPDHLEEVQAALVFLTDLFHRGQFPLQTCCTASNIGYIAKGPYKGLLEVYEERVPLGDLLVPCSAPHARVDFHGIRYRRSEVERAADQRKDSPFQYLSWRVQKDRKAHFFLPMAYGEYDVTAAISQATPAPTPDSTYGDHLILWKREVLDRCTFKIGDSGKPTRSFLVLLSGLLQQAVEEQRILSKLAVFNLLLLAMQHPRSPLKRLQLLIRDESLLVVFPDRPLCALDLEAHLYGDVGLPEVDLILAPCSSKIQLPQQEELLLKCQMAYRTKAVQLYDSDALKLNEKDYTWGDLVARL